MAVLLSCLLLLNCGVACGDRYEQDDKYRLLTDAATKLLHRNLHAAALAKCNQALKLHSDGQWALLIKALSIRGLGDYEAADLILKQLIRADPDFSEAHMHRAIGFGDKLQFDQALVEMGIFSKLKGKDAAFSYTIYLMIASQKNEEATKLCLEQLKRHPDDSNAKLMLAISYAQANKFESSLAVLDGMTTGKTNGYYEWRAYCEAHLGRDRAARKDLTLAIQNQNENRKNILANQILLLLHRKSPALVVYESICPELVREVKHKRGLYSSSKSLEKRVYTGDATPDDYRQLGDIWWQSREHKRAILCYNRYLDKKPNATGFLARAKMYAALLMDDKAIADCNSALQLSPNMEEAITLKERCMKRQR